MSDNRKDKTTSGLADVGLSGKRQRNVDEEDLGSQQSILKWMRHVPGPLQDVMKKRADQLDTSQADYSRIASANSDRYSVAISTVFDHGPWVDMCQYLGMSAVSGTLYGSIKMRSLKHTVQSIVEDDEAVAMVPQLLVLIKSVQYVDEEIVAVFHDPTGEVEGYFHRELVEHIGPALVAGVGVLLHKVSIFTPTDAPVTGRRKSYLNITPRNVRQVFIAKDSSYDSTNEDLIKVFNKEQEIELQQESDSDDFDDSPAFNSEQGARQVLLQRTVRDTSAELTFLSQRQVVHRNPPVRVDPAVATTAYRKGTQKKSAAASKSQDSGLGKWQWSKLVQKASDSNNDDSAMDSVCTQKRQGLLDASSRLVSLITKQNARNRSLEPVAVLTEPRKSVSIQCAPETVSGSPSVPRVAFDSCDSKELTQGRLPSQSDSTCHIVDGNSNMNTNWGEDDDDDDW
ncbi:unnamed protein product [Peronospora belbahrii]|uniref:Homologous recombination OB-fold protein OB-fold domain-containing protein n=1 Tax=Peronospora belbahrii TaxID=622444 RepID=A0AAU9LDP9_9STRA|nr:unnamed protein product [Peronospora belbahrii]CAH0521293.1 unnamed protein product [Peronospora belbahrii]